MSGRRTGRLEVGLALSPERAVALRLGGDAADAPREWALEGAVEGGAWVRLREALAEMRGPDAQGRLHVALLPPLAQVRRIELPRMRLEEARRVLARDAARYFPGVRDAQVVDAAPCGAAGKGRTALLAAAASAALVDDLRATVAESGWTLASLAPAECAWAAAARAWGRELTREGAIVVALGDRRQVVYVADGTLDGIRRFPRVAGALELDAGVPAAVVAPPPDAEALAAELEQAGVPVLRPAPDARAGAYAVDPAALAASHADSAGLSLLPAPASADTADVRRLALRLCATAAVLVAVAAGVELWGAKRELAAVQARRAEIRQAVGVIGNARSTVRGLNVRFAALQALEAGAPRWPVIIAGLAEHLPTDAHLTSFRADGDSLLVEGDAVHAAAVFDALRGTPGLVSVRAAAPVRRDFGQPGPAVEHFVAAARLGSAAQSADSAGAPR